MDTLTARAGSRTAYLDYGGLKAFGFLVSREDSTRIGMRSSTFGPQMGPFGPTGTLVVRVDATSSAVMGDSHFRESGRYLVIVSDKGANQRGAYALCWTGFLEGCRLTLEEVRHARPERSRLRLM